MSLVNTLMTNFLCSKPELPEFEQPESKSLRIRFDIEKDKGKKDASIQKFFKTEMVEIIKTVSSLVSSSDREVAFMTGRDYGLQMQTTTHYWDIIHLGNIPACVLFWEDETKWKFEFAFFYYILKTNK